MFKLVRFFLLTSTIVAAVIAAAVFIHWNQEVDQLTEFAEQHNVALAQSFANTIWPRFSAYVGLASELNPEELETRPEVQQIQDAVKSVSAGLPILKVKIYDLQGLTVYSSQADQIGENKANNPGFFSAAKHGQPASKLTYRDTFSAFEGTVQDRDLVESYIPIRQGNGPVEGVFELYSDVTAFRAEIKRETITLLGGFLAVAGVLYVFLFLVVRRADLTIKQQYIDISDKNVALERENTERRQAEKALVEAKEAAEQAEHMKSHFLANVSHEIRTPMNGVLGMAALLLKTKLTDKQREYAGTIYNASGALLGVINSLLDLSTIEAGKLELEIVDFDLRELVEDSVEMVEELAQRTGLELCVEIPKGVPLALRGDSGRLREIVLNLLSNAIKFTERGEVVLRVECLRDSSDVAVLRFEVHDTGIGIPADAQARLFEPFSRVHDANARKAEGTGLGLTIVKELVRVMGGELGVTSEIGIGSCFHFSLSIARQSDETPSASVDGTILEGVSALIVDDNTVSRNILRDEISALGAHGDAAESAGQALEMLHDAVRTGCSYDVALIDLLMPDTNGLELVRAVNANPTFADTGIVMLAPLGRPDEAERASLTSPVQWLTKPVRQRALYEGILAATGRGMPSNAEPPPHDISMPGHSARILVVEDNPVNQTVIRELLTVLGHRPRIAGDGPTALETLSRDSYDLVFMDCQLPGMDGFATTAEIRSRETENEHIPIVALTARALAADHERCLAAGMDDHLSKPITEEALVAALARWCPGPATVVDDPPETLDADVWASLAKVQQATGQGFSVELVELFVRDSTARLRRMRDASDAGHAEQIVKEAHALRGGCHQVGANGMADLCGELEKIVRATGPQGASELLDSIGSEFAAVQRALKHRIDSLI